MSAQLAPAFDLDPAPPFASWQSDWETLWPGLLDLSPGLALQRIQQHGLDRLPQPGAGRTLDRWRALAHVAAHDLSLVKLYEGHTDALAILAELEGPQAPPLSRWGTWCAEPPAARLRFEGVKAEVRHRAVPLRLSGTKAWCSGAKELTHALVSGWDEMARPCLAAVDLQQPRVRISHDGWNAVGMAATQSVNVAFDNAEGWQVGAPGDYTARAGFWRGGAGIAACWWGGAWGLAGVVRAAALQSADAHRLAQLGAIDVAMVSVAALLRESAHAIDQLGDAPDALQAIALRTRLAAEACATQILQQTGLALGAGPLCQDARVARRMADLPVFLRQSHGARDLAALGRGLLATPTESAAWPL